MRDSEQRSAQTDNTIACMMYCLSSISGKLFVALSLTPFICNTISPNCRIVFNISSRGSCTTACNLLLNLTSTPILLTFNIFHQFTTILINAAVYSRPSTFLIPGWLMIAASSRNTLKQVATLFLYGFCVKRYIVNLDILTKPSASSLYNSTKWLHLVIFFIPLS